MLYPGYGEWKYSKAKLEQKLYELLPTIEQFAQEVRADCLIVSGTSGVWLGAVLTLRQDLPVVIVRKPGEASHGRAVEGDCCARIGVIVDDFIASGATVDRIANTVMDHHIVVGGVIEHEKDQGQRRDRCYRIANGGVMHGRRIRVVPCDYANKGGY